uniref:Aspartic proteinase nepenthesin-1 n=1 Tax=Aegilops tauschii TaxID=37682 RepID=R7W037_AEGTA
MSMRFAARALLLPLVIAALLHPADVVAGGGFSLRLVPSPGSNRSIHVDDDGFVHLNEDAATALRPPMHTQIGGKYSVVTSVGTGAGRRTYVLALDMTSSKLWMQCKPVQKPFAQQPPPFEPAKSPSFRHVPGNSRFCLSPAHGHRPTVQDPCKFRSIGLHGIDARGVLSNETLAFAAAGQEAEVAGVVIGCTHSSEGFDFNSHGVLAGVLGLGRQAPSLIWTLGQHRHGAVQVHRFSYCLPSHGSPDHHSFLRFGDDIPHTQHMVSTRILYMSFTTSRDFSAYFVTLAGVSVGGRQLPHIGELFKRHLHGGRWTGGCAFDAGTAAMVMVAPAYEKLKDAVVDHLKPLRVSIVSRVEYHLCFRATSQLWQHLPTVTLPFAEAEARLVPPPQRLVVAVGHDICLAVVQSNDITIIGAMQQVDKRFVYDVRAGRIYFAPENACHADAGHQI